MSWLTNPHNIIFTLDPHHGVNIEQRNWKKTRCHSPLWEKERFRLGIDNLATVHLKPVGQALLVNQKKKIYVLLISTIFVVISEN